ncbi:phosphoenolpyruvate--protein phosphotransferase [Chlamydiota bacterium]
MTEKKLSGIAASPGIVNGKVILFDVQEDNIVSTHVAAAKLPFEIARLEEALIITRREILDIQQRLSERLGVRHAEIFNAHLMVLEDRSLLEEVIKKLEKDQKNVEFVFNEVIQRYSEIFSQMEDEYLKERVTDIKDVARRVLHNLMGKKRQDLSHLTNEVIVIASDLSPSDTALMHTDKIIGFATDAGSRTSHTAIMARTLEIPAVVGLHDISSKVKTGDWILLDGKRGIVVINPSKATTKKYKQQRLSYIRFEKRLEELRDLPATTRDGKKIIVAANIELPDDVSSVISHGACGVGLYRTEFLYMNRTDLPSEEEQYAAYNAVATKLYPHDVIIRTLDLGGDKFASQLDVPREMNPFLGWRAIRFCLERLDIFEVQLRAILRASVSSNVKLMYPMISTVSEVIEANKVLESVKNKMRSEGIAFNNDVEVGVMIEIPSAALTADIIAKYVDFFSIGTNDLIQYSLAVDRINEKVAYLYEPGNLGVLRLIKNVIECGHKENILVGMCGEMASEPEWIIVLLGMGLDEFSTSPSSVPEVKKVIRSVNFSEVKALSEKVLTLDSTQKVHKKVVDYLKAILPEIVKTRDIATTAKRLHKAL